MYLCLQADRDPMSLIHPYWHCFIRKTWEVELSNCYYQSKGPPQAGLHKSKMKSLCKSLSVEDVQLQKTKSSFLHLLLFILFHLWKVPPLCLSAFLTVNGDAAGFSAPGGGEHAHKDGEGLVLSFVSDPKKKSGFSFCDSNKQDRRYSCDQDIPSQFIQVWDGVWVQATNTGC